MMPSFAQDATPTRFRLTSQVESVDPTVVRLTAAGDIDVISAEQLHKAVIEALRRHRPDRIEVDMHDVVFLDSSGIRCLLMCGRDCLKVECRFVLMEPQPMTRRVLRVTALEEHFGLAPSAR